MQPVSILLEKVRRQPERVDFGETIAAIEAVYQFTPTSFINGSLVNDAGQNNGSCKIFAFARLHQLTESQTLALFGDYYRQDVLQNPDGQDHQNIRNFMQSGWAGVQFSGDALQAQIPD